MTSEALISLAGWTIFIICVVIVWLALGVLLVMAFFRGHDDGNDDEDDDDNQDNHNFRL